MKIAVIASGHIPSHFAHSINTVKHANGFASLGNKVELLTVERFLEVEFKKENNNIYDWYGVDDVFDIKYQRDNFLYYKEHPLLRKLFILINILTRSKVNYINDPEKKLVQHVEKNNFDLLYCRTYRAVKYAIEAKIPVIMETHNHIPEKNHDLMSVLNIAESKYFKGIVTIHESLKDKFIKLGVAPNKIFVKDDAVDLNKFLEVRENSLEVLRNKFHLSVNKKIITYVGQLYRGRGIEYILKAAKNFKDSLFLIIGGTDKDLLYYKRYNEALFNKNVFFIGQVPNTQVPYYLVASDILIMPYTKDIPTWKHMSPIKMFEYIAAGKPIIGTKLPAIENILINNENGILINEKSSKEIVKAIDILLNDLALYQKIQKNNMILAEQYTYKKRCENILEYFLS